MAWFNAFRNSYGFTSYRDNRTPVTYDIPLLIVSYICVLVAIATLIATLGIRGRERWSATVRAVYAVGIGSIILLCLEGYSWQEGEIKIRSHYVYRNNLPFDGYVGIKVGLRAVNVTLDGYYRGSMGQGHVLYSESMPCSDYGKGTLRYNDFLRKGLPDPILRVMAFLTFDEGELRWGRDFQSSGYYALALLWTSFAFWIVSNVLLCSVIVYGAYMFLLTGLTMVIACIVYHVCQKSGPLIICFSESSLTISYSWCYWLTLGAGCLTSLLGFTLIICDHFAHEGVSEFFHLEKLREDDIYENEDRRDTYGTLIMDRRGSVVPPSSERRGSIFLDPSRQPGLLIDKLKIGFLPGKSVFTSTSKSEDKLEFGSKFNPLYNEEEKVKTPISANSFEDQVRVQMECVCEDSEVCLSTKKPSLATLKEHRENHANEMISSAGPSSNRYICQMKHGRRVSYQEGNWTTENAGKDPPSCNERRDSCPPGVGTADAENRERSLSQASSVFAPNENLNHINACTVLVDVESRRDSAEDSGTSSTSIDSGRWESGEGTDRSKTSSDSQQSSCVK